VFLRVCHRLYKQSAESGAGVKIWEELSKNGQIAQQIVVQVMPQLFSNILPTNSHFNKVYNKEVLGRNEN
jgi:hypothetical protein